MGKHNKSDSSSIKKNNELPEVEDAIKKALKQVRDEAAKKIEDGLSKPTASTGTPIDDLHGLPKIIAQKSNIGGGSLATGGGGYQEGDRIIKIHDASDVAIKALDLSKDPSKSQNSLMPQKKTKKISPKSE